MYKYFYELMYLTCERISINAIILPFMSLEIAKKLIQLRLIGRLKFPMCIYSKGLQAVY